jgi:hypothetical protein
MRPASSLRLEPQRFIVSGLSYQFRRGAASLETLLLIAAYDQMAAAFDQLRSQMVQIVGVLSLSPEQHVRIAKAFGGIEAAVTSIDELLAFERSEER